MYHNTKNILSPEMDMMKISASSLHGMDASGVLELVDEFVVFHLLPLL